VRGGRWGQSDCQSARGIPETSDPDNVRVPASRLPSRNLQLCCSSSFLIPIRFVLPRYGINITIPASYCQDRFVPMRVRMVWTRLNVSRRYALLSLSLQADCVGGFTRDFVAISARLSLSIASVVMQASYASDRLSGHANRKSGIARCTRRKHASVFRSTGSRLIASATNTRDDRFSAECLR